MGDNLRRARRQRNLQRDLKARLAACEFHPWQSLPAEALAREYGVERGPIDTAFSRLAAEELLLHVEGEGYVPLPLSEDKFRELYEENRALLSDAVDEQSGRVTPSPGTARTVKLILHRLRQPEWRAPDWLMLYTAELFSIVGGRHEPRADLERIERIEQLNDRLRHLRVLECRNLLYVPEELTKMGELCLAGRYKPLAWAIDHYHRRRSEALPSLLERWRP